MDGTASSVGTSDRGRRRPRGARAAALLAAAALALAGCSADVSAPGGTERTVLLSPDFVARAAESATDDPQAKWLLGQPRAVRASYVHAVLDRRGDRDLLASA